MNDAADAGVEGLTSDAATELDFAALARGARSAPALESAAVLWSATFALPRWRLIVDQYGKPIVEAVGDRPSACVFTDAEQAERALAQRREAKPDEARGERVSAEVMPAVAAALADDKRLEAIVVNRTSEPYYIERDSIPVMFNVCSGWPLPRRRQDPAAVDMLAKLTNSSHDTGAAGRLSLVLAQLDAWHALGRKDAPQQPMGATIMNRRSLLLFTTPAKAAAYAKQAGWSARQQPPVVLSAPPAALIGALREARRAMTADTVHFNAGAAAGFGVPLHAFIDQFESLERVRAPWEGEAPPAHD